RVPSWTRTVFVRDVAREAELGERAGNEPVIELLGCIWLVPIGNAGRVIMRDQREVLADIRADVPFHDLHVIDVEEDLDARRVDAPTDFRAPLEMIEHRVGATEIRVGVLAVDDLDADGHALVFGVRLDAIQERRAVLSTFLVADPAALATDRDDVRPSMH